MKFKGYMFSAALALAAFWGSAQAVVLHDQPLVSWSNGWCSPCTVLNPARTFGSFSLGSDSVVTGGRFAVEDASLGLDDLNISIWDVPGGTLLFELEVAGGTYVKEPVSDDSYWAVIDLPSWSLGAGDYFVSLFGKNGNLLGWGTDFSTGDDLVLNGSGNIALRAIYVGFSLSGDSAVSIPEPLSLTLLGAGLAALGWTRRRSS